MKKLIYILIINLFPFVIFSQNLVSISPNTANAGQTLNVTITGNNTYFTQGSGTGIHFSYYSQSSSSTIIVNSSSVVNDNTITGNITVPSTAYTGNYTLAVYGTIYGTLYLNNGFYVNGQTPPSLVSISPSSANTGQTLNVTITGASTNFTQGSGTYLYFSFSMGSPSIVNSLNVVNNTTIDANITVPSNIYSGYYDVTVIDINDGTMKLYNGFYINGLTVPQLVSVNPSNGVVGQTLNVTITGTGTHFMQGSLTSVEFQFYQSSGTTVVNSYYVVNDTIIQSNITIPPGTSYGNYDVTVHDYSDGYLYLYNGFHVGYSSAEANSINNYFEIYPNPTSKNIIIQNNSPFINQDEVISIFNMHGQLIEKRLLKSGQDFLNIENLDHGLYYLKIDSGDTPIIKKFIKE